MVITVLLGAITIYLEIKNRERKDKIFYTFYLLGMSVIILPFFGIFDSSIPYIIFTLFYTMLLYGIYTDFEIFTRLSELFLTTQHVDKKALVKLDYEFLELLIEYFTKILKAYKIKVYQLTDIIMDEVLIGLGILVL
jgi:hypothetical protein